MKKEDILAISEVVEKWADDNGIVAHDVEQFELAERSLNRFREERQAGVAAYQARDKAVLAALKKLQRTTPYNALIGDLMDTLQAADRSTLNAHTEELAACQRTVIEADAATNRDHEEWSYEEARCAVVRMGHAGADALNEVQELRREIAESREALAKSRARVAVLEATLDGDPNQQATPEERRAWRRSAVRYADQLEEGLAACQVRSRRVVAAWSELRELLPRGIKWGDEEVEHFSHLIDEAFRRDDAEILSAYIGERTKDLRWALQTCRARERQLADALDEILAIDNTSFPDPRKAATAMRAIAVCVDAGCKIGGDEEALAAYGGPAGVIEAAKRSCDGLVAFVNRQLAGGVGMLPEDVLELAVKVTSVADRLDELTGHKTA